MFYVRNIRLDDITNIEFDVSLFTVWQNYQLKINSL